MTNDDRKSEREQYKLIKDAYITEYTYDKDIGIAYITLASGKKTDYIQAIGYDTN